MKIPSQVPLAAILFYVQINVFELDEHRAGRGRLSEEKKLSWLGRPAPTSTIPALEKLMESCLSPCRREKLRDLEGASDLEGVSGTPASPGQSCIPVLEVGSMASPTRLLQVQRTMVTQAAARGQGTQLGCCTRRCISLVGNKQSGLHSAFSLL